MRTEEERFVEKCLLAGEMSALLEQSGFKLFLFEAEKLINRSANAELNLPDATDPERAARVGQVMRVERRGMEIIAYLPRTLIAEGEAAAAKLEAVRIQKEIDEEDPRDGGIIR